jgi:GNAT superfamily N-acetyltransferase
MPSVSDNLEYRLMQDDDVEAVSRLITEVFAADIAPLYGEEGVQEFLAYSAPDKLKQRSRRDHFVLLACHGDDIVAVAEMRTNNHLALFFVSRSRQRQGVGRELLRRAIDLCSRELPDLDAITVNASPNAVAAYERLGFVADGAERTEHGIRFTPMLLRLPLGV